MKKIITLIALLFLQTKSWAWDWSYKLNASQYKTSNANLTSTDSSDTVTNYGGSLQMKDDKWKWKVKGQAEKYQTYTENDFYSYEVGPTYNRTKNNDYSISYFNLVYNNVPTVNADTASDNSGIRIGTNIYNDIDKDLSNYISITATNKNYSKLSRTDRSFSGLIGLESNLSSILTLNPEASLAVTKSSVSDYSTYSYGPGLYVTLTPLDDLEFSASMSYAYTLYSTRTVSIINSRGKSANVQMHQELVATEVGASYYLTKHLPFTIKYSTSKNSSNNVSYDYKANIVSFGLGYKF